VANTCDYDEIVSSVMSSVPLPVFHIDYCINVTCKNGGSYIDGLKNYKCSCVAGFTGHSCEIGSKNRTE